MICIIGHICQIIVLPTNNFNRIAVLTVTYPVYCFAGVFVPASHFTTTTDNFSGRYTVHCNLAEIVVRVSSYNDKPRTRRHTLRVNRAGVND